VSLKLILLEDDELFGLSLEDFLDDSGFDVDLVTSLDEFYALFYDVDYDLMILDINLPDGSGLELLKSIRESNNKTPAIFLTSYRDREILHLGFESGADDFLRKPVDLDELLFRINAIFNRLGKSNSRILISESLEYSFDSKAFYQNKKELNISLKATKLFELFYENQNSIITKDMIIDRLWSYKDEYSEGSIRVYISSLKKILPKDSIINLKGLGYKFELKV
jgi:DNA-binding response OmpR family regulator